LKYTQITWNKGEETKKKKLPKGRREEKTNVCRPSPGEANESEQWNKLNSLRRKSLSRRIKHLMARSAVEGHWLSDGGEKVTLISEKKPARGGNMTWGKASVGVFEESDDNRGTPDRGCSSRRLKTWRFKVLRKGIADVSPSFEFG